MLTKADAQSRRINVKTKINPEATSVFLDKSQMTQAILNLMLNSLNALDDGGAIEIGTDISSKGNMVNIWIEDNGKGIPDELKNKIFEPYFSKYDKGTGLGLSIVNIIAKNHRGLLFMESPPPGKSSGARFTISIPVNNVNTSKLTYI